ncbi:helix-turn-helix domain-containing protein [Mycobacterium sp. 29Ha]|uniref:helix-turn-helix transcriptional regulator n=1 Tax=Mycobacterium sp. 29Ha TaxID=2939268 RepID=UPI0029392D78|nr:helix-turn-helix domain-containing protein [Mycobacterium sp. 29Ha]MDV3133339.1 helix-turn-helix domain-containing protein [Mycobacterium sp. 29Ha]
MSIWSDRSCWASIWFDVEKTAALTGLKPDTIYHYVSRKDAKFPQPSTEGGRIYFSSEQVFRYILERRRKARDVVPRLFPRTAEPPPAQFVHAQRARVPKVGNFAVHTWQPADNGALIAVAYPDGENTMNIHDVEETAAELLKCVPPKIEAVAVPNGETTSPPLSAGGERREEPTVVVVERNRVYRGDPVRCGGARYKWSDLANLLRVDIPWWSPLLRDLDIMLSWQPGAPVVPLAPYAPEVDTGHITALAGANHSAAVRDALDKLASRVLARLNGRTLHDRNCLTPGLIQAAISTVDITQPEPVLTADEAATILHHRAPEHAARHALRVAGHWAFMPVLTHVIRINRTSATSMAIRWVQRLVDVAEDRHSELGFWFVRGYLGRGALPVRWLTDPDNENTWIIQGDNGIVYAGVGTSTPGARGQLLDAEINDEAAFFRDGARHIWPLPDTGFDYYRTGYEGSGPQRLAETLATLLRDATADVHKPELDDESQAQFEALYRLVSEREAPITITADSVGAQR